MALRAAIPARLEMIGAVVTEQNPQTASPFQAIRAIDYTVIFARDMPAMRRFYEDVLRFPPGTRVVSRLDRISLGRQHPGIGNAEPDRG